MRDYSNLSSPVKKSNNKINKRVNLVVKLLLIVILFSLAFLVIINLLGYNSDNIVITDYDTISNSFKTKGLLIRNEQVVFASQAGRIKLHLGEGKRVSAGNLVATIDNGNNKDELYNYEPGIISYKVDGLENSLGQDDINNLSYNEFSNLKGSINPVSNNDRINLGHPIFKVINNFKFYLAVLLPAGKLQNYELDDKVKVAFPKLNLPLLDGKVYKTILDSPQNLMVIEVDRFNPKLVDVRKTKVKVIKEQYHGIVVPSSAIIKAGDKTKVRVRGYVKDYSKEVKLKGQIDDKAVIKKGIGPGTKVILN